MAKAGSPICRAAPRQGHKAVPLEALEASTQCLSNTRGAHRSQYRLSGWHDFKWASRGKLDRLQSGIATWRNQSWRLRYRPRTHASIVYNFFRCRYVALEPLLNRLNGRRKNTSFPKRCIFSTNRRRRRRDLLNTIVESKYGNNVGRSMSSTMFA